MVAGRSQPNHDEKDRRSRDCWSSLVRSGGASSRWAILFSAAEASAPLAIRAVRHEGRRVVALGAQSAV